MKLTLRGKWYKITYNCEINFHNKLYSLYLLTFEFFFAFLILLKN